MVWSAKGGQKPTNRGTKTHIKRGQKPTSPKGDEHLLTCPLLCDTLLMRCCGMPRFVEKQRDYIENRDAKIVKANELIQKSRYQLSTNEQKIILYLISRISPKDTDFKEIVFSIQEFCKICGIEYGGKSYEQVKAQIKSIADKSIWVRPEPDKPKHEILLRWLNEAEIDEERGNGGFIKIKLHNTMKPYLLQLRRNFTQYEYIYVLRLKSKYSIRMYELLKSVYYDKSKPYEYVFDIEELKNTLDAETYTDYKDFKKRVLNKAVEEINEYTDLKVSYEKLIDNKIEKLKSYNSNIKDQVDIVFLREKIDEELGTPQMSIWEIVADRMRQEQEFTIGDS